MSESASWTFSGTSYLMRKTTTLTIHWLAPLCWVRGHDWVPVTAVTVWDYSGRTCKRCETFQACLCDLYSYSDPPKPLDCPLHPR